MGVSRAMYSQTTQPSDAPAVLVQTPHLEWDQCVVAYCCVGLKTKVSKSQMLSVVSYHFRWHTGAHVTSAASSYGHAFLNAERQLGAAVSVHLHELRWSQCHWAPSSWTASAHADYGLVWSVVITVLCSLSFLFADKVDCLSAVSGCHLPHHLQVPEQSTFRASRYQRTSLNCFQGW